MFMLTEAELNEKLANAFDEGVGIAGRYGHEDNWDSDENPYNDNPYRPEVNG